MTKKANFKSNWVDSADSAHEAAFTLIEVLVALTLFSMVTAIMAPSFIAQLKFNTMAEDRSGAIAAAQQVLDAARALNPDTLPNSGSQSVTLSTNNRRYVVTTAYCVTAAFCTSRMRHLKVSVSYKGQSIYNAETVFARLE